MPLIAADDVLALSALLLILTFVGFWADNHPFWRKTSGVLWVILGGMLLSNLKVVPFEAPTYGFVFSVVVRRVTSERDGPYYRHGLEGVRG